MVHISIYKRPYGYVTSVIWLQSKWQLLIDVRLTTVSYAYFIPLKYNGCLAEAYAVLKMTHYYNSRQQKTFTDFLYFLPNTNVKGTLQANHCSSNFKRTTFRWGRASLYRASLQNRQSITLLWYGWQEYVARNRIYSSLCIHVYSMSSTDRRLKSWVHTYHAVDWQFQIFWLDNVKESESITTLAAVKDKDAAGTAVRVKRLGRVVWCPFQCGINVVLKADVVSNVIILFKGNCCTFFHFGH